MAQSAEEEEDIGAGEAVEMTEPDGSVAAPATASATVVPQARDWMRILARYRGAHHGRSLFELTITIVPLVLLWIAAWAALTYSYWLSLLLALPAAGFLVRLFMIQHDCGHGAFFRHRSLNDWVGRAIGVVTLTPYDFWRRTHNMHHAGSGNLARRGVGDVATLTVNEYLALSPWRRLGYRLYRHPLVLFGIAPSYLFLVQHRLPAGFMRQTTAWVSPMATNAAIGLAAAVMIWVVGVGPFLLVHLPITIIGASIGMWLFYVQHQFEDTHWTDGDEWNLADAALHGSSHYDLPKVLRWFTANIGVHHVHHLCSRIPYYRLPQVLRDHPEFGDIGRLSLVESMRCVRLVLWDEIHRRLISFRQMRREMAEAGNVARRPGVVRVPDGIPVVAHKDAARA